MKALKTLTKFAIFLLITPAWATISTVQHVVASGTTCGSGTITGCTLTVASTGTGHVGVVVLSVAGVSKSITSVSDGTSVWSHCAACGPISNANGASSDIYWTATLASGKTSVTVHFTSSVSALVSVWFIELSGGSLALDAGKNGGTINNTVNTNRGGVSLSGISGTNDVLVQAIQTVGNITVTSVTTPYGIVDHSSPGSGYAAFSVALNTTNGAAPTWTFSSNAQSVGASIALSEASANWVLIGTPAGATQLNDFTIDDSDNWYITDRHAGGTNWVCHQGSMDCTQAASWTACTDTGLGSLLRYNITWDHNHSQLLLATQIGAPAQNPNVQFWKSSNCTSWTQIPYPTPGLTAITRQAPPHSGPAFTPGGSIIWGGDYGQPAPAWSLWYSTNGGTSTTQSSQTGGLTCGTNALMGFGLYYSSITADLWAGSEDCGMFRSTDGGVTWQQASSAASTFGGTMGNGDFFGITSDSSGCIIAGEITGIWKSCGPYSGTATWTKIFNLNSGGFNNSATRFLFTDPAGNIYWSHNKDTTNPAPIWMMPAGTNTATCSPNSNNANSCFKSFSVGLPNLLEGFHMRYNSFDGHLYAVIENGTGNVGYIYRF